MGKCAYRPGCSREAPKNHKYCSREHSPYGHLCKENYIPPPKTVYRTYTDKNGVEVKRLVRKYSRKPDPKDFIE